MDTLADIGAVIFIVAFLFAWGCIWARVADAIAQSFIDSAASHRIEHD